MCERCRIQPDRRFAVNDDVVERVMATLEGEFTDQVDGDTLRAVVQARARRFANAPIQDFVPMLVTREVRQSLLRHT
jgi:hypothetical protein